MGTPVPWPRGSVICYRFSGTLSRALIAVGGDRTAQQMVFQHLSSRTQNIVYDLSFVFSCSDTVNLAEPGEENLSTRSL